MTLDDIIRTGAAISLPMIGADHALATDVQTRLAAIGVLDPPADGAFGPVSHWALTQVMKRLGVKGMPVLDKWLAKALVDAAESGTLFALKTPATLEGRLVKAMLAAKQWVARHPDCVNVVYVEGMDLAGAVNDDAPNIFNDLRVVLRVNRAGNPEIVERWDATTEPGKYYTSVQKADPRGAARVAFGQYKAWSVGTHRAGTRTAHEALVQTAPISVFRDLNEDFERWDATTEPGKYYTRVQKIDPRGAARIAFGQYKAWSVGTHRAGSPTAHEALVQTAPISVFRDLNEDFERQGDSESDGLFGINQHWGYDLPKSDIGRASAGCLVGRTKSGHRKFMALCKADPRYIANNSYRFMTTVMPAAGV